MAGTSDHNYEQPHEIYSQPGPPSYCMSIVDQSQPTMRTISSKETLSPNTERLSDARPSDTHIFRIFLIIIVSLIIGCVVGGAISYLWATREGPERDPTAICPSCSTCQRTIPTTKSEYLPTTIASKSPNVTDLAYSSGRNCPPFWTHFGDNCYRFFGKSVLWAAAEAHCNEFFNGASQGHLISIHSKEESAFVFQFWHDSILQSSQLTCTVANWPSGHTASPFNCIFLGLNDIEQEGVYVWTDGTPNDYNEWGPNQPSQFDNEHCTHWVDPTVNETWKPWNNLPCLSRLLQPYVCKLSLT